MKYLRRSTSIYLLAPLFLVLLSSCDNSFNSHVSREDTTILITDISIVNLSDNEVIPPKDILITGDKITEIAEPGSISQAGTDTLISGEGLFIIPGLIDVHAHIGNGGIGHQTAKDREEAMSQFVHYGVTSIFVPGGGGGNDHYLSEWKSRCSSAELLCPEVYGSGALITAPGSHPIATIWNFTGEIHEDILYQRGAVAIDNNTHIDSLIQSKVNLGVDGIKIIIEDWAGEVPRLSNELIDRVVQASHNHGLRVFAHVSMPNHIADAIAYGVDGIMHSVEDRIPDTTLIEMAQRETYFVATLSLYDGFIDRALGSNEEEKYAIAGVAQSALTSLKDFHFSPFRSEEEALEVKDIINENLHRASEIGVPLALGTDVNNPSVFPGYSVHEEMALMVEAGLSPATALEAATTGGATFLGEDHILGRIESGYEADLLILKSNPLENILHTRTLHLVILNGNIVEDVVSH